MVTIWCARSGSQTTLVITDVKMHAFRSPRTAPEFRKSGVIRTTSKREKPPYVLIGQECVLMPEYVPFLLH
jgi:hypothetical protein